MSHNDTGVDWALLRNFSCTRCVLCLPPHAEANDTPPGPASVAADGYETVGAYAQHSAYLQWCSEDDTVDVSDEPGITYRVEWEAAELPPPETTRVTAGERLFFFMVFGVVQG